MHRNFTSFCNVSFIDLSFDGSPFLSTILKHSSFTSFRRVISGGSLVSTIFEMCVVVSRLFAKSLLGGSFVSTI